MTTTLTPVQAAFVALGEHCASCPTCTTMNADGSNANLPCETADRLDQAYKDARRAASADAGG